MFKKRKIKFLLIGFSLLFLLGNFFIAQKAIGDNITWKTHSISYYKINYPANWKGPIWLETVEYKDFLGNSYIKFIADNNSLELEIIVLNFDHNNFDYIEKSIQDTKEEPGLTVIDEKIKKDGHDGYKIIVEDQRSKYIFYIFAIKSTVIELKFICKKEEFINNQVLIDEIYNSFQIKDFKTFIDVPKGWNKYKIENIEVYFPDDSVIYDNVEEWARKRVDAFNYITNYLGVKWDDEPVKFYVFNSMAHGKEYNLLLGFAFSSKNEIFTLHSQSPGHELTHVISYKMAEGKRINSELINEGLATYLDMTGKDYHRLSQHVLKINNFDVKLLGNDFRKNEHAYTLGASFVKFLIDEYGLDLFKNFYSQNKLNEQESFKEYYGKSGEQLVNEWKDFLKNY